MKTKVFTQNDWYCLTCFMTVYLLAVKLQAMACNMAVAIYVYFKQTW